MTFQDAKIDIQFLGAAQTVTGSRTVVTYRGKKYLVDCGLFQGPKEKRLLNWEPWIDAKSLSAVFITHAHIDHSGYLPRLVKEGFTGPIYCSPGTADLCEIMLLDSAHLQEEDAKFANKSGYSHHKPALPLYTTQDAQAALKLIRPMTRDAWHEIAPGFSVLFLRSGHILGSSFIKMSFEVEHGARLLTFSGDIGNGRSEIIKPPVAITESDYMVVESTYGDRLQSRLDPAIEIEKAIREVSQKKSVLVIPAFSVGRTQEILFIIRKLEEAGKVPKLPVFVDSPMANSATDIYLAHPEDHALVIRNGEFQSPICSSCYKAVITADESMLLCMQDGPMVVISAAGMLTGGRIMHHLKHRLNHEENIVLFVGFQPEGTKGRLLLEGLKEIRIHHELIPVEASIRSIDSLSAHADANDIIEWLARLQRPPQMIFINHGEPNSCAALAERVRHELGFNVCIPAPGEKRTLT